MAFNDFDDYPVLDFQAACSSTEKTIRVVLDALGFLCSVDKEQLFSGEADLLGVRVRVGDLRMRGAQRFLRPCSVCWMKAG